MTPRTLIVVGLAVVSGLAASLGVIKLQKPPVAVAVKPEVQLVPVLSSELLRGDKIAEEMISEVEWPKDLVPQGALLVKTEIVGKVAQQKMMAGEIFLAGKIGDNAKFSERIAMGMRGVAILTPNENSFVAGMIEPGDLVDVIYTNKDAEEWTGGAMTRVLMQGIEVLAIGNVVEPDRSKNQSQQMRSVTLGVSLEKSQVLDLAAETGSLHLVLRNDNDLSTEEVAGYTYTDLQQFASTAVEEKVAEPSPELLRRIDELELALREQREAASRAEQQHVSEQRAEEEVVVTPTMTVRTIRGFVPGSVVMRLSEVRGTGALFKNTDSAEPSKTN